MSMIHVLFSSPSPASIQNTCLFYVIARFYTHPAHIHLFIIVSLMTLRMEVEVPCAGGLGSYDSHGWNPGQGVFHGIIATSDACAAVTPVKCPFGHTLGTLSRVFSLEEVLSEKQETEGAFWEFCCLKQNKKHGFFFVVVDQQLLIYALENVQRTQCFWKGV